MPKIISNGKVVEFPSVGQGTVDIDPTLTKSEDGTIGVTSPVQSILTQEEFDALPVERQDKGLYVIKDENNNDTARSLTINGQTVSFPSSVNVHSNLKPVKITLLADNWDDNGEQMVDVPDILADESLQLITPTPSSNSFNDYYTADIKLVAQGEGVLTFRALNDTPSVDCEVLVYIQSVTENAEPEFPTEYIWWSPEMTSNNTPTPYVASASSEINGTKAYLAFDLLTGINNNFTNYWHSSDSENQWIQFDFGSVKWVRGVRIFPISTQHPSNGWKSIPKNITIYGSNDGEKWDVLYSNDGANSTITADTYKEYVFDKPAYRRYFRIENGKNYNNGNLFICTDIEFYRPESEVTA